MILSFSGIDSAGKSTQVKLLSQYCKDHKISNKTVWSKARGTPGIVFLKSLVRRDKQLDEKKKAEYRRNIYRNDNKAKLLYCLSLLDLCWYWGVYCRILGCIKRVLICDRYLWDTYVELKCDFPSINIDRSILWRLLKKITPKPKVSFVFVVPAEVSLARDQQKDADGIESIERKIEKINNYLDCLKKGCWTNEMDGLKTIDALHFEVINSISKFL